MSETLTRSLIVVATCAHPAEDGRLHILETAVPAVIRAQGSDNVETSGDKRRGFTLIELIATLLLGGVLTMGAASLVIYMVQGFNTVRQHAGLAQGIELAMGRLVREARHADTIAGGGANVTFTRGGSARFFSLSGGTLGMQVGGTTYPLMRNVAGFTVLRTPAAGSELITFTITPAGAGPVYSTGHLVVPSDG